MLTNEQIRKKRNMEARKGNNGLSSFGNGNTALEDESNQTIEQIEQAQMKQKWRRYYISYALHMFIPIYGTYVFIFVMITTFKGIFGD